MIHDEIGMHRLQTQELRERYYAATAHFLSVVQSGTKDERINAFQDFCAKGVALFNCYEKGVPMDAQFNLDLKAPCYSDRAETSINLLETIAIHYETLYGWSDSLGLDRKMWSPSRTAFANMQRIAKNTQIELAEELRQKFVALGLPTHGFDFEESASMRVPIPAPPRILVNLIAGDQHVENNIVGRDAINSAIGSKASIKADSLDAQIQNSSLVNDVQGAFAAATIELAKLHLAEGDRSDVNDDLTKLKAELDKNPPDEKRIKTVWGRIQSVAPTVAAILSTLASLGKIVGVCP